MRKFEYPYNDNSFWIRNFLPSVMLQPFTVWWWVSAILSPLVLLVVAVFYEVMLRKWLTLKFRKLKNWFYPKKIEKDE
jgi:hypothetical protein